MNRLVMFFFGFALSANLAFAEPSFRMTYPGGVPRVEISGDYQGATYSVWRATEIYTPFERVSVSDLLCLESCYADDYGAIAGRTYWYRFDIWMPDGRSMSFGPYAARIDPERVRRIGGTLYPNPGRGGCFLRIFLAETPGSAPVRVDAVLLDLQGRQVAVPYRGFADPGRSFQTHWDGRGSNGEELASGTYILRISAADGRSAVTKIQRIR